MYTIRYDKQTGNPDSISKGGFISIPIDERNNDFQDFLAWNEKQQTPLDWKTPIAPEVIIPPTEIVFPLPVRAPDFLVSSPKPKDDPIEAMTEAVLEGGKANKSIALMVLSFAKYLDHVEKRMKKGKL